MNSGGTLILEAHAKGDKDQGPLQYITGERLEQLLRIETAAHAVCAHLNMPNWRTLVGAIT